MSNTYLEKIALTVEEAKSARKQGEKAFRKTEAKGALVGAGLGGAAMFAKSKNAALVYARSSGGRIGPGKARAILSGVGAVAGGLAGSALSQPVAVDSKNRAHTKALNKYLSKSAAVTLSDVRKRNDSNTTTRGLYGDAGFVVGGAAGAAGVGATALHKGLRESKAYSALGQKIKNDRALKRHSKSLGGNATLMGKGNQLVPAIDGRGIGQKAGATFGRVVRKAGLAGALGGAVIGSGLAVNHANKKLDEADAKHYSKLSAKKDLTKKASTDTLYEAAPKKKPSTLMHALGAEGTAIATGLAFKAVGSRMGGGKIGNAMANSKLGRAASKAIWQQKNVGGRVLMGEVAEYTGSVGGIYGALKYKEHLDNKKSKKAALIKSASILERIKIQTARG